ncbi:MAG: bifunctional glutamate N-acetyltransferase/amino-acid acetyltransferase ArgJ [Alphaproteobacteria bacterium]|nr:bifunctional glutamate N-acetyltransferase/amino-acid acetyltransferase ArgJ [Alphaproteobacteria bacterium]MBU0796157.1 bifunctional glutamate N-acetyltransferase/amino-acid acetyltransferase ArgJ [Alphaproteobacteria bacterium]MBU0888032.1 bifunctional glutamate N-acetyltransferase/amino-acid acetyltransferase ArgJ [Alphaproteobacteria bacterium]MBU1813009.1 bifunctional glutamate N-acetyltransferase/amino-acid acetyltransferase ArgJ [Alphaproteobacteria bacterium]MBU2090052.1 bifunctional
MPPIAGVTLSSVAAGVRYKGRTDLFLAELAPGTSVAGALTKSLTASAPVEWCRANLAEGQARAVLVNSGNANAFTGKKGYEAAVLTAEAAGKAIGCPASEVFLASTGVIGELLPAAKVVEAIPALRQGLKPGSWAESAKAIMTTDTFPKGATRQTRIGDVPVTINGICKGSGMIAPDMATMLGFVFTDAAIPPAILQEILTRAVDRSFNCITVDSDTSTSDTVLLFATGNAAHLPIESAKDSHLRDFRAALEDMLTDMAIQIVRDGEGAQKLVTIDVTGAASARAARRIGLAIANSPLVKTAIAGEDANWGRIVMAVGKSGEWADRDRLSISIGGVEVAKEGAAVDGYDETPVVAHMKTRDIAIEVDVGVGRGRSRVWTCDLTHGYIDINGSYRS